MTIEKIISSSSSSSSGSSSSDGCIVIDSIEEEKSYGDKQQVKKENNLLKIKPNMKVYALYDKTRHIWKTATLVEIKSKFNLFRF